MEDGDDGVCVQVPINGEIRRRSALLSALLPYCTRTTQSRSPGTCGIWNARTRMPSILGRVSGTDAASNCAASGDLNQRNGRPHVRAVGIPATTLSEQPHPSDVRPALFV